MTTHFIVENHICSGQGLNGCYEMFLYDGQTSDFQRKKQRIVYYLTFYHATSFTEDKINVHFQWSSNKSVSEAGLIAQLC